MNYRHISSGRASELADHVYSLGAYTQANEILALVTERDALLAALRNMCATMRTFRDVPPDEQQWTCLDDAALDAGFAALDKVQP